ncbi:MAG: hypothetical protein ACRDRB_13235 [Pseudonocardiaceae bacterium]
MALSLPTPNFGPPPGLGPIPGALVAPGGTISNTAPLGSTVASILGLQETAATDEANAAATKASLAGYTAEGTAYGQVEQIAGNNVALARVAGDITGYQQLLAAKEAIGSQQQGVAAAGLRRSGSNLDLLRFGLQQTYLQQQVNETQTSINVGGYLAEGAAAKAEGAAAGAAGASATALGSAYTRAASLATVNAANETAALEAFIGGNTLTPEQQLLLGPLTADPTVASQIGPQAVSAPPEKIVIGNQGIISGVGNFALFNGRGPSG